MVGLPRGLGTTLGLTCTAAGILALWLRFNAEPPRGGFEFPYDLLYYYVPVTEYVASRLTHGELPLWNPHVCGGTPALATLQGAVLYPGTWLSLALPAHRALPLLMLLETGLGAAFTFGFFRARGATTAAAVTGGVLYAFSCLIGQSYWPPALSTLLWLPWLLWCVEELAHSWRWRWWIALVLGITLQWLAGFPQFLIYSYLVVTPYAVVRLCQEVRARRRTPGGALWAGLGLAGAVVLGAGGAGVQLLPTLELIAASERAAPLGARETHYLGALSLARLLANTLDPGPKLVTLGYKLDHGYLGIATLLLAAFGVASRLRTPETWAWIGLGAIGLLLAPGYTGATSNLYEAFASLPIVGSFRSPDRLLLLPTVAVITLATVGLDALGRVRGSPRTRWTPLVVAAVAAGAISLAGASGAAPRAFAALGAIVVASIAGECGQRRTVALVRAALALLIVVDVVLATGASNSLRALPIEWARRVHMWGYTVLAPEDLPNRGEGDLARVDWSPLAPHYASGPLGRTDRIACYGPLLPRAWHLLEDARARAPSLRPEALYDAAGVRTVVEVRPRIAVTAQDRKKAGHATRARLRSGLPPAPGPPPDFEVTVRDNADALPRAYLVHDFEIAPLGQAIATLLDGRFDVRRRVLLDRPPAGGGKPTPGSDAGESVRIVSHLPERVEIEVEARRDGLLVSSDSYFPGWRAFVDDDEVEILRANGLFRAVPVSAGHHRVVLEYAPASLRWGAALSLASFALVASVPAVPRALRRSRRARRQDDRGGNQHLAAEAHE